MDKRAAKVQGNFVSIFFENKDNLPDHKSPFVVNAVGVGEREEGIDAAALLPAQVDCTGEQSRRPAGLHIKATGGGRISRRRFRLRLVDVLLIGSGGRLLVVRHPLYGIGLDGRVDGEEQLGREVMAVVELGQVLDKLLGRHAALVEARGGGMEAGVVEVGVEQHNGARQGVHGIVGLEQENIILFEFDE